MLYEVKNWRQYQHYKDRNPPWIKLHFELLTSKDWVKFDDASKLLAVVCLMLASRNNGIVEDDLEYIKNVAHLRKIPDLKPLIDSGFLMPDSMMQADASTLQADAIIEESREEDIEQKRRATLDNLDISMFKDFIEENSLCPEKVKAAIPGFIDYWKGAGKNKKDWIATFRNYVRDERFGGLEKYRKISVLKRKVI